MNKVLLILILISLFFSSCLTSSRIGYHQQAASFNNTKIRGGSVLLLYTVPLFDDKRQNQVLKWLQKLDDKIVKSFTAKQNGVDIPAYISSENMDKKLSKLAIGSPFQFLMLVDGYPMPTEINGGNLVSVIIEVWDIKSKEMVYNSHSTVKSKQRYTKVNDGSFFNTVFNGTVGTPIEIDELLYYGIKREIQRLKVVY